MRVLLKLVLDCPPEAAWRAIRSPAVLNQVSAPLTAFQSLESGGFPELWSEGVHPVRVRAGGLVHIGDQTIEIAYPERATGVRKGASEGVRAVRDTGRGLSGPLAVITRWEHTMTVTPLPGDRTLYRDQLVFEAGRISVLLWPMYWAFWQWRAIGIRRLAPTWR
ncbi:MAG: hypothetical protein JWQ43_3129 [Glaciihabitans sp.]|nr:hypothetical protein [Glaciihabitans sp.]